MSDESSQTSFYWNQLLRYRKEKNYRYRFHEGQLMRVNIISPDAKSGWIIYKFGKCMYDQLKRLGYDAVLSSRFDSSADINHYFAPNNVGYSKLSMVDDHTTFMITHVDTALKLNQIKDLTSQGALGVCMSHQTHNRLISCGVEPNRVCYINPAQDGQLAPKKVALGFTYMVHNDCRKRDDIIVDACREVDPDAFRLVIMGAGWEDIVAQVQEMGFEVEYYPEFEKGQYNKLMAELDYYCYFGFDEGSMGFLDAVAAGVGTIVTPQGYHLDAGVPITYPVNTLDEIVEALLDIQKRREKHVEFVKTWTWENYALKHIEIWKYMLGVEKLDKLLCNRGRYIDGIFSLLLDDLDYYESLSAKISKISR